MQKKYTHQEVYAATFEYFDGDEIATDSFIKKYALHNAAGEYLELTPDDMHRRLAREFARIESSYPDPISEDEIYELFRRFKYIVPQGSPMSGVGNKHQLQSLSNCFVIKPPYDSYGGLMATDREQVEIMKRRGGVGFDISTIRPKGAPTANAAKTTDGLGIFMERYSRSCAEVAQGGRRGALMLTLSCHHPEVHTFFTIKNILNELTGERDKVTKANISIRMTDEFMQAVESDGMVELRFPVDSPEPSISTTVNARTLWQELVKNAHEGSEPGLLFWDTIKRYTPADCYKEFETSSTNPCGEIGLSCYDSCRLMAVNVSSFVKNPYTASATLDLEHFGSVVEKAQRLMDDLVDLELESIDKIMKKIENDPEPIEIRETELRMWKKMKNAALRGRRTGLGLTALADTLAALGLKYGSDESISVTESIYKTLALAAYRSSCKMAADRGAFPAFSHSAERGNAFIDRIMSADPKLAKLYETHGRRNISLLTTAPTGTVSLMTQTSAGIEPVLYLKYTRRRKINPSDQDSRVDFIDGASGDRWQEYEIFHHGLQRWIEASGDKDIMNSPYAGATAEEIDWHSRVAMQAAAQKWVCHSISSTVNLPEDVSTDIIEKIYFEAWKMGCKGITIYRDNSRSNVMVKSKFRQHMPPSRPENLKCNIHHVSIKGEAWTILVGLYDDMPYEIFGGLSATIEIPRKYKVGSITKHPRKSTHSVYDLAFGENDDKFVIRDIARVFDNPTEGAFTRTISLALRTGASVAAVVEQLQKDDKDSDMFSFSRVMARVLKSYIPDGTKSTTSKCCASCGAQGLVYQEGCITCIQCGWSKCS